MIIVIVILSFIALFRGKSKHSRKTVTLITPSVMTLII